MQSVRNLSQVLKKYAGIYFPVVSENLNHPSLLIFDLSASNKDLQENNFLDTEAFSKYIFGLMAKAGTPVAIGKYNEDRIIYRRSKHFIGSENRTIHLGIDIWAKAGTKIYSPLSGKIHSFRNNKGFGDYGPTIILEHTLESMTFYTLYGHLCLDDIVSINCQQEIKKGALIGKIGNYPENGDWPPHLHFQIIANMSGFTGDFPGVSAPTDAPYYLQLCPDPNLILGIKGLT